MADCKNCFECPLKDCIDTSPNPTAWEKAFGKRQRDIRKGNEASRQSEPRRDHYY